ncbi:MAG: CoA-binding protein, partial [Dethiobacteria bacterium]
MLTKEQLLTEHTLAKFFVPQGVAIIGASKNPAKVGNAIVKNLLASRYAGHIYPINPREKEILGLKCFQNVQDIPSTPADKGGENVELAVIAIPAAHVLAALQECAQRGIRYAIVITAGFKETGPQGMELENKLTAFCREQKIRLLGPNCVGLIHTHTPIN